MDEIRSTATGCGMLQSINSCGCSSKPIRPASGAEQDEYIEFSALIYHCNCLPWSTTHNAKSVKALSWSLSQETAEWFAHRFGEDGTVYVAIRSTKKHI